MADLVMVVGGSSSGKSELAEKLAAQVADDKHYSVTYIATGTVWDDEFARRVEKHRERRPADWQTIEEPCDLHKALQEQRTDAGVWLIDGIGTWVTNLMYRQNVDNFSWDIAREKAFLNQIQLFIDSLKYLQGTVILVADEVGMDLVPSTVEGRTFRDLNGRVNRELADKADKVYLVVCGIPVKIKE